MNELLFWQANFLEKTKKTRRLSGRWQTIRPVWSVRRTKRKDWRFQRGFGKIVYQKDSQKNRRLTLQKFRSKLWIMRCLMKNVPALSVMPVSFRSRILRFVKRRSSCRQNWGFSNIIRQYTSALNVLRMIIQRFQKLRYLVRSSVTVRRDPLRSLRILPRWSTSTKFLAIARKQCGSLKGCRWLVNKCQSGWSTSSIISFCRCMIFYWKSWRGSDFFTWMKHLIILWPQKKPTLIIGLSQA